MISYTLLIQALGYCFLGFCLLNWKPKCHLLYVQSLDSNQETLVELVGTHAISPQVLGGSASLVSTNSKLCAGKDIKLCHTIFQRTQNFK